MMKLQRISALTEKELKKTIREPAVLFMIFIFPIIFVFAFGASFGGVGSSQTVTYNVGVVNMDGANSLNASQILITTLSNTKILNIHVYSNDQTARNDLSQGIVQAVMIIPTDFSQSLASYQAAPNDPSEWTNATVSLYLDQGSLVATQAIPPIIQQALMSVAGHSQQSIQSPFSVQTASLVEVETRSAFDLIAPGMFTFASIFLIMMVAQSFTQDRENGMMKRIRISPTTSTEFITSQVVSYMCIALIQAVLVFGMTYALGFRPDIGLSSYLFAFVLVLIFSLSNVGFGLITATISKSASAATGLSFLFVMPQLFLGTFVGASLSSSAQVAGRFVPSFYVTNALTSLFLRGAAFTSPSILLDLAVVSVSCVAILAVGIVLYSKRYKI
ncbi:MAG TPA: ABC transporter permease [Candidatus Limnocylindrales bacterium]|nr:ABC transporter permease [Candidatus Limnocylindrales bacterium]